MLGTGWPPALSTFTAIAPLDAEYAPTGGESVVTDRTGLVPPMFVHVTDSETCTSCALLDVPASHRLVDEDWLTHCTSWVIVYVSPLTVRVVTVCPITGSTTFVNFAGSAAGPADGLDRLRRELRGDDPAARVAARS